MGFDTVFNAFMLFMNVLFIVNLLNYRTKLVNLDQRTAKFITPLGNIAVMYDYMSIALENTQSVVQLGDLKSVFMQIVLAVIFTYLYVSIGLTILISYRDENPFIKIRVLRYSAMIGIVVLLIMSIKF